MLGRVLMVIGLITVLMVLILFVSSLIPLLGYLLSAIVLIGFFVGVSLERRGYFDDWR